MYIKRDAEVLLKKFADQYPAVTITGPRQSGKTTICRHTFPDKKYVSLEDLDYRDYAEDDPRAFLSEFSNGVIIDEIQRVPSLLSYIQGIVDRKQKKGEFILTGSSQFELSSKISQSLAGRTAILKLLPFSFLEVYSETDKSRSWMNKILYTGFYPRIFNDKLDPTDSLSAYIETYVERDVRMFSEIRELKIFRTFLRLCAARTGQLLNYSNLSNACGVSVPTIKNWISILEQSYLIFLLQPYHSNLKKRLVKTPKMYFYDVGLCAYLNGAKKSEHLNSLPNRGSLFENFIIAEMLKMNYHHGLKKEFNFYRDKSGVEIDTIIDNGIDLLPIEIKSASTFNKTFTKNLNYFSQFHASEHLGTIVYTGLSQVRSNYNIFNFKDFFNSFVNYY
ncbi:MAG: ATP-binding protein [Candidatus Cloacimonetes bacterium]|nr:ATP-binding protein [Candidatus Cloacimonadota bacterium]